MNSKKLLLKLISAALFFVAFGTAQTFAQPTDAQLKKLLSGPKVISSVLYKPGKKVWSSSYSKYTWDIGFTNRVKDTDNPGLVIVVTGIMSFDIIGGRYVWWRDFITENTYEGIPNPTEADLQAAIKKFGTEEIFGNYFAQVVGGKIESIRLSKTPNYEWHTPNSVSFNFTAIYTEDLNIGEAAKRVAREYRLRLYRDDKKSDWKNFMTDQKDTVAF